MPLWDQIQQFATVRGNMSDVLGNGTADFFIGMSHCIISVGSNDFFEKQNSLFRNETQPQQLIANLTATYAIHLQVMFGMR